MRLLTWRKSTFVVGLVSLAASAGCALIADLSQFNGYVAVDGGVSPGVDSSTGDDQSAGDDATTDEASSSDGSTHDGGDAVATGDGPATDTGPNPLGTSWCSVNVDDATMLCDDFDEGASDTALSFPRAQSWGHNDTAGEDGFNTADYAQGSAPRSLNVITPCAGPGAGCVPNYIQDQWISPNGLTSSPHGIVFSFALKIEDFDVNASDVSLVAVGNGSNWRLSIDYAGGATSNGNNQLLESTTNDAGVDTFNKTVIGFPDWTDPCTGGSDGGSPEAGDAGDGGICIGGWVNFQLMVDFVGTSAACAGSGGPCATLTYNGKNAFAGGAILASIAPPPIAAVQVVIGANYIQAPAQGMLLQYDNIKVEALP
jgi:hypothetical protein